MASVLCSSALLLLINHLLCWSYEKSSFYLLFIYEWCNRWKSDEFQLLERTFQVFASQVFKSRTNTIWIRSLRPLLINCTRWCCRALRMWATWVELGSHTFLFDFLCTRWMTVLGSENCCRLFGPKQLVKSITLCASSYNSYLFFLASYFFGLRKFFLRIFVLFHWYLISFWNMWLHIFCSSQEHMFGLQIYNKMNSN